MGKWILVNVAASSSKINLLPSCSNHLSTLALAVTGLSRRAHNTVRLSCLQGTTFTRVALLTSFTLSTQRCETNVHSQLTSILRRARKRITYCGTGKEALHCWRPVSQQETESLQQRKSRQGQKEVLRLQLVEYPLAGLLSKIFNDLAFRWRGIFGKEKLHSKEKQDGHVAHSKWKHMKMQKARESPVHR